VLIFLVAPWVTRLTGELPDLGPFRAIEGDTGLLVRALALVWVLAAFGEELVYRGTLARRVAGLGDGTDAAWRASLALVNVLFALGHASQGLSGVILTGLAGFGFAHLFRRTGRNLWAPILAHGTFDTIGVVLLYLGAGA
jgi:membrane protease YdiL (CAAX protease family)